MNARTVLITLIVIAVLMYIILFTEIVFKSVPLTEAEIKDLVNDRYPTAKGDPVYDEDCIICDATGCHPYGEPCWKIKHTEEDAGGKTSVESSVDEGSGEEIARTENPCTEWWCDADPCTYDYTEVINNITHDFTNHGCDNPSPTCDQEFGLCRSCSTKDECIRTEMYVDNGTTYIFSVVGTNGYSIINDSGYICRVFDGDDMLLINTTTISECELIANFYSKCGVEGCKFEPSFGMIPY